MRSVFVFGAIREVTRFEFVTGQVQSARAVTRLVAATEDDLPPGSDAIPGQSEIAAVPRPGTDKYLCGRWFAVESRASVDGLPGGIVDFTLALHSTGAMTEVTPPTDHPLWHPEFDALMKQHTRMEGSYPFETYPYDMAGIIADWLRDRGLDGLADLVVEADPRFLHMSIEGWKSGYLRDSAVFGELFGSPPAG